MTQVKTEVDNDASDPSAAPVAGQEGDDSAAAAVVEGVEGDGSGNANEQAAKEQNNKRSASVLSNGSDKSAKRQKK